MPRKARLDTPGTLHHVIVRGIEKGSIVVDDTDRWQWVERIGDLALETETRIFAWALMTNHLHLLLKSSAFGLPHFMRRLLTGYAVWYNRRHQRHGHLFQNRYKSIVCEEDAYFKELVRYIHLNPIRADMVDTLKQLEEYPWCGHRAIVGKHHYPWQDHRYVLRWFGNTEGRSKSAYQRFMTNGLALGNQPDLVGGGLIRSMGGWSQVVSMRKSGMEEKSDERILGSGEFVEALMQQANEHLSWQIGRSVTGVQVEKVITDACRQAGVSIKELKGGSRRHPVSELRSRLILELVEHNGLTLAETARQLGVTTAAVSKKMRLSRNRKKG